MRRFSAPVAHFHASKVCIYVFFMSENQRLKFQIVAFSSSKCTYGLDFEDSGGFGLCLHIADVRDIIWKFVFKCDDVESRLVHDDSPSIKLIRSVPFFVHFALFQFSKFNIVAFKDIPEPWWFICFCFCHTSRYEKGIREPRWS